MYAVGVNNGLWRRCDFCGGPGVRVSNPDDAHAVFWRAGLGHVLEDVILDEAEAGEVVVDRIEVVLPVPREFDCSGATALGL